MRKDWSFGKEHRGIILENVAIGPAPCNVQTLAKHPNVVLCSACLSPSHRLVNFAFDLLFVDNSNDKINYLSALSDVDSCRKELDTP